MTALLPATFPQFVDSTMVACYRSCPRKYFYEFNLHLQPIGTRWDLHAGAAFAAGAEATRLAHLAGATYEEAVATGVRILTHYYGPSDPLLEEKQYPAKTWLNLINAFRSYWAHFGLDTDTYQLYTTGDVHGVEYSFAIPMEHCRHTDTMDPLLYVGRFDALVHRGDLLYWLDDKTTGNLGSNWATKWNLRGQFIGYTWALEQNTWPSGFSVAGGLVRGIGLYANGVDFLQRDLYFTPSLISEWKDDLEATMRNMLDDYESYSLLDVLPPRVWNDTCTAYNGCPFLEVCRHALPEGLPTGFEQREWHPIALEPLQWEPPTPVYPTENSME